LTANAIRQRFFDKENHHPTTSPEYMVIWLGRRRKKKEKGKRKKKSRWQPFIDIC